MIKCVTFGNTTFPTILLFFLLFCVNTALEFSYYASYKDNIVLNQLASLTNGKVKSKLHCVTLCLKTQQCVSVHFDRVNKQCTLLQDILDYEPIFTYGITTTAQMGSCPFRHVQSGTRGMCLGPVTRSIIWWTYKYNRLSKFQSIPPFTKCINFTVFHQHIYLAVPNTIGIHIVKSILLIKLYQRF